MRYVLVALFVFAATCSAQLKSPSSNLSFTVQTVDKDGHPAETGRLVYSIKFAGKQMFNDSGLRLDLAGQQPLGTNVRITKSTPTSSDSNYHLLFGPASTVRDHYNAITLDVEEPAAPSRKFSIEARAYDDAIAFRYVIPEQDALKDFRLEKERTQFAIVKDATVYGQVLPNYQSMYESEYFKFPISAMANQGGVTSRVLLGLPTLLDVPGVGYVAITEADIHGNAAMYLTNPADNWGSQTLESRISPSLTKGDPAITGTLPHHSAWRVLMIGNNPGTLIESNVILSLNPESQIKDTSWIHPGKSAWDWWSGSADEKGESSFTTANIKHYVDFAAKSGFEYMLIDAGWSKGGWGGGSDITQMTGEVDIPAVVEYAKPKNVKVWIWAYWSSADRQMKEAFPLYEKWGVAGVKIDMMSQDDQKTIDWYYRTAELAAKYHLMVDFHGATKPTGMERTWPNVMGYEAVMGMEHSKGGMRDNPDNHVMIPFTRMLTGPMDYTPGGFDNVTREDFVAQGLLPMVMGSRAHHLAMYAVYYAPFQMVSDCPQHYENEPSFQFIKDCPSTWDETKFLTGRVGEFIAIARRHGDDWYLGAMTAGMPRTLTLPLNFLGAGQYTAEIYADAPDSGQFPKHIQLNSRAVNSSSALTAELAANGGYAVHLHPARTK